MYQISQPTRNRRDKASEWGTKMVNERSNKKNVKKMTMMTTMMMDNDDKLDKLISGNSN